MTHPTTYPKGCTFAEPDWDVLSQFWYPIAFSHSVKDEPVSATLLDQRLVIWRTTSGLSVANDICLHRGIPLSMGHVHADQLVCKYHGFHYSADGRCVLIPSQPGASIPPKLCLKTYPVQEAYGLVWTSLAGGGYSLPEFFEWGDANYQQILPNAVDLNAAAGRQVEGFLDVAHFAWVHTNTFGDSNNPIVPRYDVTPTANGVHVEYLSTVSNFPKGLQDLAPADFEWLRVFDVYFPFTARLTVHFPWRWTIVHSQCCLSGVCPQDSRFLPDLSQLRSRDAPRTCL